MTGNGAHSLAAADPVHGNRWSEVVGGESADDSSRPVSSENDGDGDTAAQGDIALRTATSFQSVTAHHQARPDPSDRIG